MRRFTVAAVAAAGVLFGAFAPVASATEPPVPSQVPAPSADIALDVKNAQGAYCVDVYSSKTNAAGQSILEASACSEKSLADASSLVDKQYSAARGLNAAQSQAAAKARIDIALLYSQYNQGGLGQRLLRGSGGPCDSAGYTFPAVLPNDNFVKSFTGYNNCNAMRTKSDAGTGGIYSYYASPGNLSSWLVGHVVEWHPYHS